MAIFDIKNLSFKYSGSENNALNNINIKIEEGSFTVVIGKSGSGKTTFLRLLKPALSPKGEMLGEIFYNNKPLNTLGNRQAAAEIGFVMQNPQSQIVTDKVYKELSFGLESLGVQSDIISKKVAEISEYLGITNLYNKDTFKLSGGEMQLVNLASILATDPKVLILDEPTCQLDPITSNSFLETIQRLNSELGITIIMSEHRIENFYETADLIAQFDDNGSLISGSPKQIANNSPCSLILPAAARIYKYFESDGDIPLTVIEAKNYIKSNFNNTVQELPSIKMIKNPCVTIKSAFFKYERIQSDVIKNLNLNIYENEFLSILGGNGAGKTTLLKLLCGVNKLYRGSIDIFGKNISNYKGATLYKNNVAYLPQDVKLVFLKQTVIEDLTDALKLNGFKGDDINIKLTELLKEYNLLKYIDTHPFDLSGGEQQRLAICKLLISNPRLILLDEPTKGMDIYAKEKLATLINQLITNGKTVVSVSHDIEFSASHSTRCAMLFDGRIVSVDTTNKFFSNNSFYTTSVGRITKGIFKNAVTFEDAILLLNENGKKVGKKDE